MEGFTYEKLNQLSYRLTEKEIYFGRVSLLHKHWDPPHSPSFGIKQGRSMDTSHFSSYSTLPLPHHPPGKKNEKQKTKQNGLPETQLYGRSKINFIFCLVYQLR